MNSTRGYTLIELMVALGLFSIIMLLASGAYLMMIGITRKAQGLSTGVDNLSFALEVMTRNMRTGVNYSCDSMGDCANGGNTFSFDANVNGATVPITYSLVGNTIQEIKGTETRTLTDASVNVSSLRFYVVGTAKTSVNDYQQPRVLMVVSGTVTSSALNTDRFYVQTGSTMRGTDI